MLENNSPQLAAIRLQTILDLLNISAFKLAKLVGITPAALYHILGGSNNISEALTEKIVRRFNNVSYHYLKSGKGSPLLETEKEIKDQHKMFLLPGEKLDEVLYYDGKKDIKQDEDLFAQVQELIFQQRKTNQLIQNIVQQNIELKGLLKAKE